MEIPDDYELVPAVAVAVSDPVGTQIVASNENPGKNITGTSDFLDTKAIFNLILATIGA